MPSVYTGTPQYAKAATEAKAVIDAGYTLRPRRPGTAASAYGRLFLADNNPTPAKDEIIWPVIFDVNSVQSYGGTTFLVNGATSGADASWQRLRGRNHRLGRPAHHQRPVRQVFPGRVATPPATVGAVSTPKAKPWTSTT